MGDQLRISGDVLAQANTALTNAGAAFTNTGSVQVGADYGSAQVSAALSGFVIALRRASSGSGEQADSQGRWASTAQASFAQLDSRMAASMSFSKGE